MKRVAFYAPMKPPDHPVPSGDREMARALVAALERNGLSVAQPSSLRVYDGAGDLTAQAALMVTAEAEFRRLVGSLRDDPPDVWITYHNYYKAPDLIGPAVSGALNLPYVQIESSRARSRLSGRWADFAAVAEAASDAASLIFYLTAQDREALERDRPEGQRLVHLRPFLPLEVLPPAAPGASDAPMLTAGMMRDGDKLASYRIIADTLPLLDTPWRLDIAGDGPARPKVEALMAPFGDRVRFLGRLDRDGMARAYHAAQLFLWPGVNEAFGMVYLEAQAAGLPVVAQNRPGQRDVLAPAKYPSPEDGPGALADYIERLLSDARSRTKEAKAARAHMVQHHLIDSAARTLIYALGQFKARAS